MVHQHSIVHASWNFEGATWVSYDAAYRRQAAAAATGSMGWGTIDAALYSENFTGRARFLPPCHFCLSGTCTSQECHYAPTDDAPFNSKSHMGSQLLTPFYQQAWSWTVWPIQQGGEATSVTTDFAAMLTYVEHAEPAHTQRPTVASSRPPPGHPAAPLLPTTHSLLAIGQSGQPPHSSEYKPGWIASSCMMYCSPCTLYFPLFGWLLIYSCVHVTCTSITICMACSGKVELNHSGTIACCTKCHAMQRASTGCVKAAVARVVLQRKGAKELRKVTIFQNVLSTLVPNSKENYDEIPELLPEVSIGIKNDIVTWAKPVMHLL